MKTKRKIVTHPPFGRVADSITEIFDSEGPKDGRIYVYSGKLRTSKMLQHVIVLRCIDKDGIFNGLGVFQEENSDDENWYLGMVMGLTGIMEEMVEVLAEMTEVDSLDGYYTSEEFPVSQYIADTAEELQKTWESKHRPMPRIHIIPISGGSLGELLAAGALMDILTGNVPPIDIVVDEKGVHEVPPYKRR